MHARVAMALCALTGAAAGLWAPPADPGPDSARTIAALLGSAGIRAGAQDVHPLDPPGRLAGLWLGRWVVLGRTAQHRGPQRAKLAGVEDRGPQRAKLAGVEDEKNDVYVILARTTPTGRVLGISLVTNVTRSTGASEESLAVRGRRVAFAVVTDSGTEAVTLLDFSGEDPRLTRGWSPAARAAHAISSFQRFGQPQGVRVSRYDLVATLPDRARVAFDGGRLVARLGAGELVIDPRRERPVRGAQMVELRPQVLGRPGLIGWAVDTARAVPWIGPRGIEWLEHEVFTVRDAAVRGYHRIAPEASGADIARDMGVGGPRPVQASLDAAADPAIGWPPEALVPMDLPRRYESEGRWVELAPDDFMPGQPGAPPLFVTTWLRADRERLYARVYVVAWDPRTVELEIRSGAAEPVDETGATGTGEVPRDRIRRLVGAFNGGFQAVHGDFGLMEQRRSFLPPKPWAATVAMLDDGSVGFGTWPEDLGEVPPEVVSFRQNLTPLVADGRFNPYGRSWWGATPPQAPDQVHTVRTGICMMQDGFVAYLWGNDLSHEALGSAMQLARCEYGIHLDMNMGLCGFELYRVFEEGSVRALGRSLEADFEAAGPVEGAPGLAFRARRLARSMNSMNFPRYVGREQRDFFYLLARARLPGPALVPPISPALEGEGSWIVRGLPHNGFPWAFARTFVRPLPARPEARVSLVRIDPDRVRTDASSGLLLAAIAPGGGEARIAAGNDAFDVTGPALDQVAAATASAGVDREGFLIFAQGPDREALGAAMGIAGVADPRALGAGAGLTFHFGEQRAARLDGDPPGPEPDGAIHLWAATDTPAARRLFTGVPFAPPRVWQAKQALRPRVPRSRR